MFDLLEKGWNYLTGTAGSSNVTGSASLFDLSSSVSSGWGQSLYGDASKIVSGVGSFLSSDAGQATAKFASNALFGKSGVPEFGTPKGQRLSAPRGSSGSQMAQAGSVDMGMTARVQNAARIAANNAQAGSPIRGTFEKLASRPARGPLLRLDSPAIRVSSRARA